MNTKQVFKRQAVIMERVIVCAVVITATIGAITLITGIHHCYQLAKVDGTGGLQVFGGMILAMMAEMLWHPQ